MLSEEEKKELLEGAYSESRRRSFETMRRNARSRPMDMKTLLEFLTFMSRFSRETTSSHRMGEHKRMLI